MTTPTFADQILAFYQGLQYPDVPTGISVLYPFDDPMTKSATQAFYRKYYHDRHQRVFLIGINPGRFGGGATGIPFTDPVRLKEDCGIANDFAQKAELSSKFVYQAIAAYGGPALFYRQFYITSVSPLGFVRDGKNLNYYDDKALQNQWEGFMAECMHRQLAFGADRRVAFSIGMGKNIQYLKYLNGKHGFFDRVEALPHPRWVMQYRLKRVGEFVEEYIQKLGDL